MRPRVLSILTIIPATALLAGCGPSQKDLADRVALAEARPVGEPVDCVPLVNIDYTRVRDDRTIDFYMKGDTVYRNSLPYQCPGLGFDESFSYKTSLTQLCAVDVITVRQSGGMRGASCGLGKFQPIETSAR